MKRYVLYGIFVFVVLGVGIVIGYFSKDTKIETKIVESKTDKETIDNLRQQLRTKTKVQIKYVNGVKDSEIIDTDTSVDTNSKIVENEKFSQKSSEKVEINPKKWFIGGLYGTNKNFGFITHYPFLYNIHIGGACTTNLHNSTDLWLTAGFNL